MLAYQSTSARRRRGRAPWVVLGALAALGAGGLWLPDMTAKVAYAIESGRAEAAQEELHYARQLSTAFENVATALRPSVVSVYTVRQAAPRREIPFSQLPEPFREFFGDDLRGRLFRQGPPIEAPPQRGLGSGVIVSDDGYVLTNNHVVANAETIQVRLSDDRTFDGRVVGTDPQTDLAVVKIDASDLHPAKLGDSSTLRVGEWVLAIGSPFQLSQTVTAGIVSATGRSYMGIVDYEDFIQTDAAINPGNSGGPLVSLEGEVVGINTAIATKTGAYNGIGFAIPSNMARTIMNRLIEHGEVQRGYLGVMIQELTDRLARSFGYTGEHGVLIGQVLDDGPAAEAGLRAGDIIVSFNSVPATSSAQLRNQVATTEPGRTAPVEIFRDGRVLELDVTLGKLPGSERVARGPNQGADGLGLGVEVATLTPNIAERLGYDLAGGVLVTVVEPGSAAERAGLNRGDVILKVGDRPVRTVRDFERLIGEADLDAGVRLRVQSHNGQRFVLLSR